jgi:uncharacterized protein YukE
VTVTVEVPAARPTIRTPDGDVGGAEALAEQLFTASSRYEEFGDEAASLRQLSDGWWGDAFEAYRRASASARDEHDALARTLERVARAATSYAETLRRLKAEADDLVDRRTRLDHLRQELLDDIASAAAPAADALAHLRDRAASLDADYRALVTDHDDLQRRTRANEDALRQAFQAGSKLRDALSASGGTGDTARNAMAEPGAPGHGATPAQVHAWWAGLSDAERAAVLASCPEVLGAADGLPAGVRDEANRILLDDDLATLGAKEEDGTLGDDEKKYLANARNAQQALEAATSYVDPLTGAKPGGQLWLYDPRAFDGDGRVAVSVGDLDTADDVAVFTPGINTDMADTASYARKMTNLYESARYNGDGSAVATMFWLGYDAPDGPTDTATLTEGRAEDGGRQLADAIDGLRASRPDDPAHLTAIGHSYGSTTTSYAVKEHRLDVDDVALIGSPGAGPADDAASFGIGRDHVYVGRDSRDLVATLGDEGWVGKGGLGLGQDPSSEDFGATRFEAESLDRSWHRNTGDAHGSYLDPDSESLYNLGLIVDGHGDRVNVAAQSHDPWYGPPEDPEWDRDPTRGVPGRSDTGL